MADDIVKRLRSRHAGCLCSSGLSVMCHECEIDVAAADEIERLRAAGDALAVAHVDDLCDCDQPECVAIRTAHDAWQEAHRG